MLQTTIFTGLAVPPLSLSREGSVTTASPLAAAAAATTIVVLTTHPYSHSFKMQYILAPGHLSLLPSSRGCPEVQCISVTLSGSSLSFFFCFPSHTEP